MFDGIICQGRLCPEKEEVCSPVWEKVCAPRGREGLCPEREGRGLCPEREGRGLCPEKKGRRLCPERGGGGKRFVPREGKGCSPEREGRSLCPEREGRGLCPEREGRGLCPERGGRGLCPETLLKDRWAQNGSAHGRVFATFKGRALRNMARNRVKTEPLCVEVLLHSYQYGPSCFSGSVSLYMNNITKIHISVACGDCKWNLVGERNHIFLDRFQLVRS